MAALFCGALLLAEDAKAPEPKPIPADIFNTYLFADNQVLRAEANLLEKRQSRDAAVAALAQFCGSEAMPDTRPGDASKGICKPKK